MKKRFFLIVFVYLITNSSLDANEGNVPFITVYGEAKEMVTPDQMSWYLVVRNRGKSLTILAKEHSAINKKLSSFLLKSGIEENKIQFSSMELRENFVYRQGSQIRDGYIATSAITFKTIDLKKYESLWFGLAKINKVTIQNVVYELSDKTAYVNRIRSVALLDAKNKAESMAATLDSEVGEPLIIEEGFSGDSARFQGRSALKMEAMIDSSAQQSMSMPGLIPVRVVAKVTFRLLKLTE